jgi:microcystin-dependent protein
VPLHPNLNAGIPQGAFAGVENVTLLPNNLPSHNHMVSASTTQGDNQTFENNYIAGAKNGTADVNLYEAPANLQALNPASVSNTGGGQPHENCQPSLVLAYCIATQGIFPSRN